MLYNYETQEFTIDCLNLLNVKTSVKYKAEDVSVPENIGLFTTFTVGPKKRPFFVDIEFVTDFTAYKKMLGFDKPIDFKVNQIIDYKKQ